jgi:two-component system, sensor histidine kinase
VKLPAFLARSVRRKTMAVVLAAAVAALLVNAVALLVYDLLTYRKTQLAETRTQAEILGRAAAPAIAFNDRKEARDALASLRARGDFVAAALYTPDGARFAALGRGDNELRLLPEHGAGIPDSIEGNLVAVSYDIVEGGQRLGSVRLLTRSALRERITAYVAILLVVMALALGAALAISAWLQRVLTGPILDIDAAARRVVGERDFSHRAQKTTEDEIGVLADAFNRMLDEVQAREAELRAADRRKDEFLATLAHELRNPLAPIVSSTYVMRMAPSDPRALQDAREVIERQVRQMVRLVDDLLDISRITTGKLQLKREHVELASVTRSALEAVEPLAKARGIALAVELPPQRVFLSADPLRLSQVLLNLLNNAVKFSHAGGRVELRCSVDGDTLVASVRDQGIGIPPAQLESIFEMFVQGDASLERKTGGLGVGLALARRLVELHGGSLVAHSPGKGQGSEFVARLPLGTAAVSASARDDAAARPQGAAKRVLVVDDNRDFATSLAQILRALGHEVRVEHDGLDGLAAAAEFQPEVAFLDIGMPGLNGFDLASRLRSAPQTRRSLLVAITGFGQPSDQERGRQAGFDLYLVKPLQIERLQDIVGRAGPAHVLH